MSNYYSIPVTSSSLHPCTYCGQWHTGVCQKIKAIHYHPDGTVKSVEFHAPALPETNLKICIKCGGVVLYPTVLPYTSKWDGKILCGQCMADLVDGAIDEANEKLPPGEYGE